MRFTEINGLNTKGKFQIAKRIIDNGYRIKEEPDDTGTSLICTKKGEEAHRIYIRNNPKKQ